MLGAGAVIIQPSSGKVVIVQDGNRWFLPKGRKDLGESIEQAALREAYEEVRLSFNFLLLIAPCLIIPKSGYRCEFMPLYHWTNAPSESHLVYGEKHAEPLYVTMTSYLGGISRPPGEYLTFWYVCQIGPDAVSQLPLACVGLLKVHPNRCVNSELGCPTRLATSAIWSPAKLQSNSSAKSRA